MFHRIFLSHTFFVSIFSFLTAMSAVGFAQESPPTEQSPQGRAAAGPAAKKVSTLEASTSNAATLNESALGTSSDASDRTAPRIAKSLMPDIGLNALFLYRNSNRGNDSTLENANGLSLQEAELQLSADVDPYSRFVGLLAIHREEGEYHFEPEEFYGETLSVPSVTLKLGKFKTALGRHNQLHTHAFAFINAPLIQSRLLGDEGYNDLGLSGAFLVPVSWFMELTVQGLESSESEENTYISSAEPDDTAAVARLRNLWDLSDESTIELGLSGANGKNAALSSTNMAGADLTFKYRPVIGGQSRSITWSTEYLYRDLGRPGGQEIAKGYYTYLQVQVFKRWWIQGRTEALKVEGSDPLSEEVLSPRERRHSALVGYVPSEFSAFRLQYDYLDDESATAEQAIFLQANFSIGAHPAHTY